MPVEPHPMSCRCRGQATPLLLVVLALAAAGSLLLVAGVRAAGEDAQAQVGADAAALAGAASGRDAAAELARANAGELRSFAASTTGEGRTVAVAVTHRRATARAAAEALGAGSAIETPGRHGLAPAMVAALARADQLLGRSVPAWPIDGTGLVIEVPPDVAAVLAPVADQAGLCQPPPQDHPVHFEPCPPTRP